MKTKNFCAGLRGLLLAAALIASGEAAAFFTSFTGAPASITCSDTGFTLAPGLQVNWDLPSSGIQIHAVGSAGGTVFLDLVTPLVPAAGSLPVEIDQTFASTLMPYTVILSATPLYPSATTSSFSFVCNNGVASSFVIANGAPFGFFTIPTLDRWTLFALALLLVSLSFVALRRRSPSGK